MIHDTPRFYGLGNAPAQAPTTAGLPLWQQVLGAPSELAQKAGVYPAVLNDPAGLGRMAFNVGVWGIAAALLLGGRSRRR